MPPQKDRTLPAYTVTSVDNALRLATILQLEGALTVSAAAARLGVAQSTAHRLLTMLVYRDFAVHDEGREYRVGPVLELAATAPSDVAALRNAALSPLASLAETLGETTALIIRTADTARFIAAVESRHVLRVGNREGMVFPAHQVTGGLVLLAAMTNEEVARLYSAERYATRPTARPDLAILIKDLDRIRKTGIAVNRERSEPGVAAVGRAVLDPHGRPVAGVSVSMPTVRYSGAHLPAIAAALRTTSTAITAALAEGPRAAQSRHSKPS